MVTVYALIVFKLIKHTIVKKKVFTYQKRLQLKTFTNAHTHTHKFGRCISLIDFCCCCYLSIAVAPPSPDRRDGLAVRASASRSGGRGFEPWTGHTKDLKMVPTDFLSDTRSYQRTDPLL